MQFRSWKSGSGLALMFFCFLPLAATAATQAQEAGLETTQETEESDLEDRLRQQEEHIRELQERVRQLEALIMAGSQTAVVEAPADTGEVDFETEQGVQQADLGDVKETTEVLSSQELVSDDFPGSWPMFGTEMRMKIGGYLKSDFVFDLDGTLDQSQFLMRTIPVEGTPEYGSDGYFDAFAKESRINLDVRRIKPGSPPMRGFVEGDFFSVSDEFRLRHAYMSVGGVLVGQTWTTLSFLESLPFTIDFAAGDSLFGGRTTQVRYTREIDGSWTVAAAAEKLAFLGISNPSGLPGRATSQYPQLAVRSDYRWDSGVLFLGSSVAQLRWDGGADGPSDNTVQYDFVVAGRQGVGKKSYATWNVAWGEGTGENIMAFAGSEANAVLEPDGTLTTIPALAVVTGFGHDWTSKWSSNLSLAYGWLDTPPSREPLALKRGGIGHVNLIWKPVRQFTTGIEFMWGAQRVQNDAYGAASRFQLMAKYEF